MFDLEHAITEWKKSLRNKKAIQDGDRIELEGYLREKIEDLVIEGLGEEEAFRRATALFLSDDKLDKEYTQARSRRGTPHGGPRFLPALVWNYWKIALRKIGQDKGYAAIAVGSLALALTVGLSILTWARYEWSYDRFHKNGPEIYRFLYHKTTPAGILNKYVSVPTALASAIKKSFPEVRAVSRVYRLLPETRFETPRLLDFRSSIIFAEPDFLTMFDFPLVQGDPHSALSRPKSVLLTESAARRFFGPEDPIGKTLLVQDGRIPMTVTGVLKDIPENSHLDFDLMMPWTDFTLWERYADKVDWFVLLPKLYVQLKPGADPSALAEKASRLVQQNDSQPGEKTFFLQPLRDIHLHPERAERDFLSARRSSINASQLGIFLLVSAAILLMGCINYTNLAAARSLKRAREIGIRKAVGAGKGNLVRQFLGESVLFALLAMIVAAGAAAGFGLPILRKLTKLSLDFGLLPKAELLLAFIGLALLIGLAAGLYPALYVSSFPPIQALKQRFAPGGKSLVHFRKALIAVQIVCAATLTGVMIVLVLQLRFIDRKDLGYDRSGLVSVSVSGDPARLAEIKNALLTHPSVLGAATGFLPIMRAGGHFIMSEELSWEGKAANSQVKMDWHFVDADYLKTFGLELAAGRFFSNEAADKNNFVLNESAVTAMGLRDPIGKIFRVQKSEGRIIGVIKDFHVGTMKAPIRPMFFRNLTGFFGLTVRLDPRNTAAALQHIAGVVKTFAPDEPFAYEFLDDILRRMYDADRLDARIVGIFGVIAIFISCLGLFGLISYAAEQRTKEIGVRKVLGASVGRIIRMMAGDFAGLVGLAVLIAGPIGYWIAGQWLSPFAYRIRLDIWIFAAAGLLVFGLALGAITLRAVRAAAGDPVEALRYE